MVVTVCGFGFDLTVNMKGKIIVEHTLHTGLMTWQVNLVFILHLNIQSFIFHMNRLN